MSNQLVFIFNSPPSFDLNLFHIFDPFSWSFFENPSKLSFFSIMFKQLHFILWWGELWRSPRPCFGELGPSSSVFMSVFLSLSLFYLCLYMYLYLYLYLNYEENCGDRCVPVLENWAVEVSLLISETLLSSSPCGWSLWS